MTKLFYYFNLGCAVVFTNCGLHHESTKSHRNTKRIFYRFLRVFVAFRGLVVSSYQTDQTSEVSDERATWVFFLSRGAEMDARDELGGGDGFLL